MVDTQRDGESGIEFNHNRLNYVNVSFVCSNWNKISNNVKGMKCGMIACAREWML